MFLIKEFGHLQIQLQDIASATEDFNSDKLIGHGGFGQVYKGELSMPEGQTMVAFKRLDRKFGQGNTEFWKEIMMLSKCKHENLISLMHFCFEGEEMILVYEYASRGSLDRYLSDISLTWLQRLKICVGAARGLSYLHDPVETNERVLHRDIKSSNILIDEQWNAKVSDFGLSKVGPANLPQTFLVTNVVGTFGYCDPSYHETGVLSKESDVYSFGVVLFEVMCGRLCCEYHNGGLKHFLVPTWKQCFHKKRLDDIIFKDLKEQIDHDCLKTFSTIAYQCLHKDHKKRPMMIQVTKELELALRQQNGENYEDTAITIARPPKTPRKTILQLRFQAKLPNTFFTGDRIESEDGSVVRVMLFDIRLNNWVKSGPMTSLTIDIVPLDGEFSAKDDEDWPENHFRSKVIHPRNGRKPLMTGNVVTLENGIGYLSDLRLTDNSKWLRGGKFMIGARTKGNVGGRIREAISQVFVVRDRRQKVNTALSVDTNSVSAEMTSSPLRVPSSPGQFSMSPELDRIGFVHLTMNQIARATQNFSPSLKLGEGGFGAVYKGQLQDGQMVAIKRASKQHSDARRSEFRSEIESLAKIAHRNLVKLLGYVDKENEQLIITEYVPNGTLREHLDGMHGYCLDFSQRLEISIDIAHGLTYLHLYAEKQIIHRDIKSSNILLTDRMRAKVADFGFARLGGTEPGKIHVLTNVKGTVGYLDPEYMRTYQLSPKSDVYSFGVLLVEILTGRRPVESRRSPEEKATIRWAFGKYIKGEAMGLLDPQMKEAVDEEIFMKMLNLAFQCVAPTRVDRPDMRSVGEQLWAIRIIYLKNGRRK